MDRIETIKAGVFGTVVGDALGVPVEFTSRAERRADPVTDMRAYGTHDQPKGTWSDDSSMMLATMDSIEIRGGIRYDDIMTKFSDWLQRGDYTPYGHVFDVGGTCSAAISRYRSGVDPKTCGGSKESDNGNGSLMRIMAASLYVGLDDDWNESVFEDVVDHIHDISCLTHAHPRSQMACMIYTAICHELIWRKGRSLSDAVQAAISETLDYYSKAWEAQSWFDLDFLQEIRRDTFARLRDIDRFSHLPEDEIRSGGYVVDTLEASIWCLLNSGSYRECVLKAVNLGDDTDTTGAVSGGLAGLYYGYDGIPAEWIDVIASKEWINVLCENFAETMSK